MHWICKSCTCWQCLIRYLKTTCTVGIWRESEGSKKAMRFNFCMQVFLSLFRTLVILTLIGMKEETFLSLSFFGPILSADFLSKISILFWRWKLTSIWLIYVSKVNAKLPEDGTSFLLKGKSFPCNVIKAYWRYLPKTLLKIETAKCHMLELSWPI